jgi:DNA-binding transcriptional MerR regulator
VVIPEKLYFRIGEVARLCRLPAYVLRFWETEFPQLKPVKSSTGQRMYRRKDVENVLHIKQLLYEEGFTIAGARQHLRAEIKGDKKQAPLPFPARSVSELKHVRQGLREILTLLSPRPR